MAGRLRHRLATTWLDVARMPADVASLALPNGEDGPRAKVRLLVDKTDAAARTVLGGLLRDEELRADGLRRRVAADERTEAIRLRGAADATKAEADRRRQKAQKAAAKHKDKAKEAAVEAIEAVAEQADQGKARVEARATAKERLVEDERHQSLERTERDAKRDRLEAVEDRAEALDAEADALTAAQEADRLADAAAAAKAERKQTG